MNPPTDKSDADVTGRLVKAIEDAIELPTDEKIRAIGPAVFIHDREYSEDFVTHYTRPIVRIIAQALRFKTHERRSQELRRAGDHAHRLPSATRDALKQRRA